MALTLGPQVMASTLRLLVTFVGGGLDGPYLFLKGGRQRRERNVQHLAPPPRLNHIDTTLTMFDAADEGLDLLQPFTKFDLRDPHGLPRSTEESDQDSILH
jgi:hypothetical protein